MGFSEEKRSENASMDRKMGPGPKKIHAGFGSPLEESPKSLESPRPNNERGEGVVDIPPALSMMIREPKKSTEISKMKRYVPSTSSTPGSPFSLDQVSLLEGLSSQGGKVIVKKTRL